MSLFDNWMTIQMSSVSVKPALEIFPSSGIWKENKVQERGVIVFWPQEKSLEQQNTSQFYLIRKWSWMLEITGWSAKNWLIKWKEEDSQIIIHRDSRQVGTTKDDST